MPPPPDPDSIVDDSPPAQDLIGQSEVMKRLFQLLRMAANSDQPVLITGEVGTGKSRCASVVHQLGNRRDAPFLRVNCPAVNHSQMIDELLDWFQQAHSGTLFFDEINATPEIFQVKLLQFLQSVAAQRMSSQDGEPIDLRVIAAANCDLSKEVTAGRFREDLYWFLSVIPIELPPLRRRPGDIELLSQTIIKEAAQRCEKPAAKLSPAALKLLNAYAFPGNLSELRNYLFRAVALSTEKQISPSLLPVAVTGDVQDAQSVVFRPSDDESLIREFVYSQIGKAAADDNELYKRVVGPVEKELVQQVLDACNQTQTKAAKRLGINRNTLYKKMVEFDLTKPKSEQE